MLSIFIAIAIALVVIALALVVWPLVKKDYDDGLSRRKADNLAILRQQYEELEADHKAGRVSDDEYEETRAEIETRVLEESKDPEDAVPMKQGKQGVYAAFALVVLIPVTSFLLYLQIGSPIAMDPDFTRQQEQMQKMSGQHSDAELAEQVRFLEERLKEHPDNADGWMMLARTSAAVKDWAKSSQAFEQVNRLVPDNADVLADWADVMAAAQQGDIEGRPKELIEKALAVDPQHWKALALMGTLCYNKGDYEGAVKYWSRMLAGVEQGSEEWRQIMENIEQARRAGGLPPDPSIGSIEPQSDASAAAQPAAASNAVITGEVDVSPEMKSKIRPDDTVFVYARPIEGSKMPVAFASYKGKDLPIKFRLDAQSQMGMGMKTLADVKEAYVEARVSRSGNFMPASGDLEGAADGKVAVGTQGVRVVINRTLP
mgnify:FL=1